MSSGLAIRYRARKRDLPSTAGVARRRDFAAKAALWAQNGRGERPIADPLVPHLATPASELLDASIRRLAVTLRHPRGFTDVDVAAALPRSTAHRDYRE
jgi:hypothetical protein